MEFVLTGFDQQTTFRRYSFDRIADDQSRTSYTIAADLNLARKHRIALQELPLLCKQFLENLPESAIARELVFGEDAMMARSKERASLEEAAAHRRAARKRPPAPASPAWRNPIARTLPK